MTGCYFWRTLDMRCGARAVVAFDGLAFCGAHWHYIADAVTADVRSSWRPRYIGHRP